mgnify:CR=1 FL=1
MPIEHNIFLPHVPRFPAIQVRKRALRWFLRWERMQDIYTLVELQVSSCCAFGQGIHPVCDPSPIHTKRWVCASTTSCASCAMTLTIIYYSLLNSRRAGITCILFIALSLSSSTCLVYGKKNMVKKKKGIWNKIVDHYFSKPSGPTKIKSETTSQPRGA